MARRRRVEQGYGPAWESERNRKQEEDTKQRERVTTR